jgi:hypothetical protein
MGQLESAEWPGNEANEIDHFHMGGGYSFSQPFPVILEE